MAAPQYSLRKFIGFVTVSAFACLIVAAGVREQLWAIGVVVAMLALALTLLVHGALFVLLMGLSRLRDSRRQLRSVPAQSTGPQEPAS